MKKIIFFKYVLFLLIGIFIGHSNKFDIKIIWTLLLFIGFTYFLLYIINSKNNLPIIYKPFITISGLTFICFAGIISASLRENSFANKKFIFPINTSAYIGIINSEISNTKFPSTEIKVQKILINNKWINQSGKVMLFLKTNNNGLYRYGDILLIKGKPTKPISPTNDWEFDYKKYLEKQGIFYTHFIENYSIKIIGSSPPNPFTQLALNMRNWSENKLKKFITSNKEYVVASAIILGIKNSMDPELKRTYQKAGVIHVLAISGMHVLLLFNFIQLILKPIKRVKGGTIILSFITLILLWLFALISGFSPSVIRATVMFTIIVFGKLILKKKVEIFNTIFVSAFFMLLMNSFLIFDLGFQLSFAAVAGLTTLANPIYKTFNFKNPILDFFWNLISSTIAAQLTTIPLILFYFNYFSSWFILTNLFMVPGTMIIVYLGVALLFFSWLPFISDFCGKLIVYILKFIHYLLDACEKLPYYQLNGFNFNFYGVIYLYICLILISLFFLDKKYQLFKLSFLSVFILNIYCCYINLIQSNQRYITVFNINNTSVIGLTNGKKIIIIKDASIQDGNILNKISNQLNKKGISEIKIINKFQLKENNIINHLSPELTLIVWQGKKIGIYPALKHLSTYKSDLTIITKPVYIKNRIEIPNRLVIGTIMNSRINNNVSKFYNLKIKPAFELKF